jgi:hypothetical protein
MSDTVKRAARVAAATMMLAACAPSLAQEAAPPPVLRAIPEKQTLPADGVFDVLGLRLGSTSAEVIARLKELAPNEKVESIKINQGMRDNRGNSVQFVHDRPQTVRFSRPDGTNETINVSFTTRINETRAMSISREFQHPPNAQASIPAFLEDMRKKYGQPSYERRPVPGHTHVHYVWYNEKKLTLTDAAVKAGEFVDGNPARCLHSDVQDYNFEAQRRELYPGCTTHIQIQIYAGTREDLAFMVSMKFFDRLRGTQNIKETDAWLVGEFEKAIKAKAGTRAPL